MSIQAYSHRIGGVEGRGGGASAVAPEASVAIVPKVNTAFVLSKLKPVPLPERAHAKYFADHNGDLPIGTTFETTAFLHMYKTEGIDTLVRGLNPMHICLDALVDPLSFSQSYQLTTDGLVYLAAYAKKTKNVDIFVVDNPKAIGELVQRCLEKKMKQFAVIGVNYSEEEGMISHVFPLLIFLTPEGALQIIDLDSRACRSSFFTALKKSYPKAEFFGTAVARQADYTSCITDSMVISCDALCHAQVHNITDMKAFLSPHCLGPTKEYQPFLLPKVWARTAQIKASISSFGEDPVVHMRRDTTTGAVTSETLEVFLARYRVYVHKTADLTVYGKDGKVSTITTALVDKAVHGFLRCKSNSLRRWALRALELERTDVDFRGLVTSKLLDLMTSTPFPSF